MLSRYAGYLNIWFACLFIIALFGLIYSELHLSARFESTNPNPHHLI